MKDASPLSDSGGILTLDLQNRNLTLYTAKLRSLLFLCKNRQKNFIMQELFVNYTKDKKSYRHFFLFYSCHFNKNPLSLHHK